MNNNEKYVWILFDVWGHILTIHEDNPQTVKFVEGLMSNPNNKDVLKIQRFPLTQLESIYDGKEEEKQQEVIESKKDQQKKLLLSMYHRYEDRPVEAIKAIRMIFPMELKEGLAVYKYLKADAVNLAVEHLNKVLDNRF